MTASFEKWGFAREKWNGGPLGYALGIPWEVKLPHLLRPLRCLFTCESITASCREAQIHSDHQLFSLRKVSCS